MIIQFNSTNKVGISEEYSVKLTDLMTEKLSQFSQQITRLEVHLSDENGSKNGKNDKRCLLEARLQGKQPIAVKSYADTHDKAITDAVEKLRSSLNHIFGRQL